MLQLLSISSFNIFQETLYLPERIHGLKILIFKDIGFVAIVYKLIYLRSYFGNRNIYLEKQTSIERDISLNVSSLTFLLAPFPIHYIK